MEAYIKRRIRVLRGLSSPLEDMDEITKYTQRRIIELSQSPDYDKDLDKSLLGCYTVSTMGDRDGET
tara:strand:+ start:144 stop:344 length:201 start_codon:yes stop_codon:yes gene_type:complete